MPDSPDPSDTPANSAETASSDTPAPPTPPAPARLTRAQRLARYRKLLAALSIVPVDLIALAQEHGMSHREMARFIAKPRHAKRLRESRLLADNCSDQLLASARAQGARTLSILTSAEKPTEKNRRASTSAFAARPAREPPPLSPQPPLHTPAAPNQPAHERLVPAPHDELQRLADEYTRNHE